MGTLTNSEIWRGGASTSERSVQKRRRQLVKTLPDGTQRVVPDAGVWRVNVTKGAPSGRREGVTFTGRVSAGGGGDHQSGQSEVSYFVPVDDFQEVLAEMYLANAGETVLAFARAVVAANETAEGSGE